MLQDPLLRLFEPEVIFIQYLLHMADAEVVFGPLEPGDADHPVQIAPDDRRFGREGGGLLQLCEFLECFRLGRPGQPGFPDVLAELREFRGCFFVAQFILQYPDLLLDEELPLGPGDIVVNFGVDLLFDLQDVVFRVQYSYQLVQLFAHPAEFDDFLLDVHALQDVGCDIEHPPLRVACVLEGDKHLARDVPVQVHVLREETRGVPEKGVELRIHFSRRGTDCELGLQVLRVGHERAHGGLNDPVDKDLHESVRELEYLDDLGDRPVVVDIVFTGLFRHRVSLRGEEDILLALQRLIDRPERRFSPHQHGEYHVRKDNDVTEWKNGEACGEAAVTLTRTGCFG